MSTPELVVTRNRWGRSIHQYRFEDEVYPSVTGILGVLKPWPLVNAAAKEVAWTMVKDRHRVLALGETDEAAAVEIYKGSHFKAWNAKRDRGIDVHAMIAADTPPSESAAPYVTQFQRWKSEHDVEILGQEFEVVHPDYGYGGKVDLDAVVAGHVTTVDIKVRDDLRVFPDRLAQVAAYCAAPIGHPEGPPLHAAVLTLGADGYSYEQVQDVDAAVRAFVGLIAWFKWLGDDE